MYQEYSNGLRGYSKKKSQIPKGRQKVVHKFNNRKVLCTKVGTIIIS